MQSSLASMRMPLAALLMLPVYFAQTRRTPLDREGHVDVRLSRLFRRDINMGCYMLGLSQTTSGHAVW